MKYVLIVYEILLLALFPFFLLHWLYKSIRDKENIISQLRERLGIVPDLPTHVKRVWIHSVSVGETQVALAVVRQLRRIDSTIHFHITTTTSTARTIITTAGIPHMTYSFFPYDEFFIMKRALHRIKPTFFITVESELWPWIFSLCHRQGIKTALVNARISVRSYQRWQGCVLLARHLFAAMDIILCRSKEDRDRVVSLGADEKKAIALDNIKLDMQEDETTSLPISTANRRVWLAASTHHPEEEIVLAQHKRLLQQFPDLLLIIVPRHPYRSEKIENSIIDSGYSYAVRSKGTEVDADTQVYLADTIGELLGFYKISQVAFIGGSLAKIGGHNPFEALKMGCPFVVGRHVHNFSNEYRELRKIYEFTQVANGDELQEAITNHLIGIIDRVQMINKAKLTIQQPNLALQETTNMLMKFLG